MEDGSRRGWTSAVERRLLLRRGKGPCRSGATLLTEDEAQLRRRFELRLVRPERRAGLIELQRAEQVDAEEALLAADLGGRSLLWCSPALSCLHVPCLESDWTDALHRGARRAIKARPAGAPQGRLRAHPANRRRNDRYPELPGNQSRSCDNRDGTPALSGGFGAARLGASSSARWRSCSPAPADSSARSCCPA